MTPLIDFRQPVAIIRRRLVFSDVVDKPSNLQRLAALADVFLDTPRCVRSRVIVCGWMGVGESSPSRSRLPSLLPPPLNPLS